MASSVLQGNSRIKLALFSCGLGNVHRGFEVSTARWYEVLKEHPMMDVKLFSGARYPQAQPIINIPRDFVLNSPLKIFQRMSGQRYWEFCYGVEQISYGAFLWPYLLHFNPDVVWTKEVPFGYHLQIYRAMLNMKFKIIFANGGAFRPKTYRGFDYIQHLTEESMQEAVDFGLDTMRMQTLTNCVLSHEPKESKEELRKLFGYKSDDYVVISIAAWNRYHKRIDYIIEEIAAMQDERVKLLLCGHPEVDTPALKQLAHEKLGERVQWLTGNEEMIGKALAVSDAFVLASLQEGLGNACIEAVMSNKPVVCHSHAASRFAIDDDYWICDLSKRGSLAERLKFFRNSKEYEPHLARLKARVLDKFGKDALVPRFYDMVKKVHLLPVNCAGSQQAMGPT